MKQADFLARLEDARIVQAIRSAEAKTSGEIRVYISERAVADPLPAAREQFVKLDMDKTKDRNGVLIFVAPESQTFAIVGDEAIHTRGGGESFWKEVADVMTTHLKADAMTDAIVRAVEKVGALLAEHFPHNQDDQDELPDRVERG